MSFWDKFWEKFLEGLMMLLLFIIATCVIICFGMSVVQLFLWFVQMNLIGKILIGIFIAIALVAAWAFLEALYSRHSKENDTV